MSNTSDPPVVLFGYDSSPFTQKIRLALKLKQVPYTFVAVSSMMPRPVLRDSFHLTYRKIPVLAIGHDIYCDTSLILEALEHVFVSFASIYPAGADGRRHKAVIRGFASYWTDRPLFRVATGLIPGSVWRTHFGVDRAELIGHKLDPDKLEMKKPRNLSGFDLHLSILEPQFKETEGSGWIFSTPYPSLADISLYYQLDWAREVSAGRILNNITSGSLTDTNTEGTDIVFNAKRYPALSAWFTHMKEYMARLPNTETRASSADAAIATLQAWKGPEEVLIQTPAWQHEELDEKNGLIPGARVSVAPDDTGRDDPTLGTLLEISPEEIVIKPQELEFKALVDNVRIHFPRIGFVAVPVRENKL